MITIVDYGMGNLNSLVNMFNRIGSFAKIESDPEKIATAEKLVLPGVGSFDTAMKFINSIPNLRDILNRKALIEKVPVLGICLGMQIITYSSDEGHLEGLCWIPARTIHFPKIQNLKIPHMGWNIASPVKSHPITLNIKKSSRYYFVHSFMVKVNNESNSLMKSSYGTEFDSAIIMENIIGVQFHPEKSHQYGMRFLKNFASL
jgi:glutamine amidotransferase